MSEDLEREREIRRLVHARFKDARQEIANLRRKLGHANAEREYYRTLVESEREIVQIAEGLVSAAIPVHTPSAPGGLNYRLKLDDDGQRAVTEIQNPVTHRAVRLDPPYALESPEALNGLLDRAAAYFLAVWNLGGLDPETIAVPSDWTATPTVDAGVLDRWGPALPISDVIKDQRGRSGAEDAEAPVA